MANSDDRPTADTTPFDLVADETRLGILLALADHHRQRGPDEGVGFADLRKRVGVRDSGNFTYHLDRLRPRFVQRTDGGYRLTHQGSFLVGSLLAGAFETHERDPVRLDAPCPFCGAVQRGAYRDGEVRIECERGHWFTERLPPGAVAERSIDEVLSLAAHEMRTEAASLLQSVCPTCYGDVDVTLVSLGADVAPFVYEATCSRCGRRISATPEVAALAHPGVAGFYYERGIDLAERPYWTVPAAGCPVERVDPGTGTDSSHEADRIRVTIELEEVCRVTMDEDATVLAVDREDA